MMKATLLYRIAALVFVLFAAGHTLGFLKFKAPTPEGRAVREAMSNVHFLFGKSVRSFADFYVGFGLYVTAYLLFSAFLSWHLGNLAASDPQAIGALGWVFFVVQVASLALSLIYFAAPPALTSAVVAACLGWAAWLTMARV
jgi:hypothetical protein